MKAKIVKITKFAFSGVGLFTKYRLIAIGNAKFFRFSHKLKFEVVDRAICYILKVTEFPDDVQVDGEIYSPSQI